MSGFSESAIHTNGMAFGVVMDPDGQCVGVITDGDIRRKLVEGMSLETPVKEAMNKDFISASDHSTSHQILRLFDKNVKHIPVLDNQNKLMDLLLFNDFNASSRIEEKVIRARAPVRVSFVGGGTDMSYYFKNRTGYVLSSTINKYCYASVRVYPDRNIKLISKDYHEQIEVENINQLSDGNSLDLVQACVKLMEPNFGFELETYSEIEPGTGLGGSSAIAAAVIGALNHFRNENHLDKYHLADLAYQAERIEIGVAGGWQDQYATVFGGLNLIEFRHDEIIVFPLRIPDDVFLELHFNLLLFRFGETRKSGDIASDQQKEFNKSHHFLEQQYEQLSQLTLKMKDALLKGSLKEFGSQLHYGWEIKKKFSFKISNSFIDDLYNTARQAGAIGGKVLGAGEGGYMLIYCDPSFQPFVIDALQSKGVHLENFDFVDSGLKTWVTKC